VRASFPQTFSPHAGIAPPLHLDHFVCLNINFEGTARLRESILRQENGVVTRLERDAEMTLRI
jgi:hypothetical protein